MVKDIDRAMGCLERISLLAQLKDKVALTIQAGRKRCGSCEHWMKSRNCPRERNVGGFSRGPSCDDYPCGQYRVTASTLRLMQDRAGEAIAFANKHSLPVPEHLLPGPKVAV